MREEAAAALGPRARRALTLMAACLLTLSALIAGYLRTDAHRPAASTAPAAGQPDLASDIDWISDREGWLSAVDRQAGTTTLLHTADAGRRWTRERVAGAVERVQFLDPAHGLLASGGTPGPDAADATGVTVYRTADGGRRWQRLRLPKGAEGQRPAFADASHGWVWSPAAAGLWATADGGDHWRRLPARGLPARLQPGSLGFHDPLRGWAAPAGGPGPPALYATADGGATWTERPLADSDGGWPAGERLDVGPVTVSPDGRGQVVVTRLAPWGFRLVPVTRWIAVTADAGATWSAPRRMPEVAPGTVVGVAPSRADGSVSWAWWGGQVRTTRDGGDHWTSVRAPEPWYVGRLQPIDGGTAWAAASVLDGWGNARWRLFATRDAGESWDEVDPPSLR